MLGFLYLISILIIGYYLMHRFTPWFDYQTMGDHTGQKPKLPRWMFELPFAWILGALVVNWTNFILCNFSRSISTSLFTLAVAAAASVWILISEHRKKQNSLFFNSLKDLWRNTSTAEYIYLTLAAIIASYIIFHCFSETADALVISSGVYSDFGPHVSLMRSFSVGDNFPPQYPHYAAGDMSYHFLFHFMGSTLEFLGMPLSWGFNLPSVFSLLGMLLLLYVLAVRITGLKLVAFLTLAFFLMRSSFAFFDFAQNYTLTQLPEAISEMSMYIGKTRLEHWGMWTINNFANQRHLAFGISAMIIALVLVLPMVEAKIFGSKTDNRPQMWRIENIQRPIFIGCFLGAIAFWNGAVLISALLVLAGFTLTSRHRLEYLIIAIIAVILASIQSRWFIAAGKDPVKAVLHIGFLADEKSLSSITKYIILAYGILVPLFLVTLIYFKKYALLGLSFLLPMVFAFTVQPTVDIAVNHKFIVVSHLFMGIFIAWFLVDLWKNRSRMWRILIVPTFVLLTITGAVDVATFHNMNNGKFNYPKNNNVSKWIMSNTAKRSVFLTDLTSINTVLYAGRLAYLGWPYFGWSAGYDTVAREAEVRQIYGAGTESELKRLLQKNYSDYIIINDAVRNAQNYVVNEALIERTLPLVYEDPFEQTRIFKIPK